VREFKHCDFGAIRRFLDEQKEVRKEMMKDPANKKAAKAEKDKFDGIYGYGPSCRILIVAVQSDCGWVWGVMLPFSLIVLVVLVCFFESNFHLISYALVDGMLQKVANYRVEPPGLFLGRGEHPKTGMFKV
jgi:hypothetical protein